MKQKFVFIEVRRAAIKAGNSLKLAYGGREYAFKAIGMRIKPGWFQVGWNQEAKEEFLWFTQDRERFGDVVQLIAIATQLPDGRTKLFLRSMCWPELLNLHYTYGNNHFRDWLLEHGVNLSFSSSDDVAVDRFRKQIHALVEKHRSRDGRDCKICYPKR